MNKIKISAAEAVRIMGKNMTMDDVSHARDIFLEVMRNPSEEVRAWSIGGLATAVYMAGYVSGIRTERVKRRKKGRNSDPV